MGWDVNDSRGEISASHHEYKVCKFIRRKEEKK